DQVEQIIGNLKSDAQAMSVIGQPLGRLRRFAAEEGAEPAAARRQCRRLAADDAEVFLLGQLDVAALADLMQFPFANTVGGFADQLARRRVAEGAGEME